MPVLFSKYVKSAGTPHYTSVFVGQEIARQREETSTLPEPMLGLLAKHGIVVPVPGEKISVQKLDAHLAARKVGVDARFELKGAMRRCGLI
jgi:hypothetical protein